MVSQNLKHGYLKDVLINISKTTMKCKPESHIELKDCKVHGTVRTYHESGRNDIEVNTLQGKLSGPFIIYHDTPSNKPNIRAHLK